MTHAEICEAIIELCRTPGTAETEKQFFDEYLRLNDALEASHAQLRAEFKEVTR